VLPCVGGTTELDLSDLLLYAELKFRQQIWVFHLQARRFARIGTDPHLLKRNIEKKPCPSARFYWPDNLFVWLPKSRDCGFWVCHDADTLTDAIVKKTFEEHTAPATTLISTEQRSLTRRNTSLPDISALSSSLLQFIKSAAVSDRRISQLDVCCGDRTLLTAPQLDTTWPSMGTNLISLSRFFSEK